MHKKLKQESQLLNALGKFRYAFFEATLLSFIANLLMLTPTIYMIQIFDQVMLSQNPYTLLALTIILIFLFIMMAWAERLRSLLLVNVSMKLDQELNSKVFKSSFKEFLKNPTSSPSSFLLDFTQIRQFITGTGIITLLDLPWVPIYLAVVYFLHPMLGWLVFSFGLVLFMLSIIGVLFLKNTKDRFIKSDIKNRSFLNAKLKNVESVVSMGMLESLKLLWLKYDDELQENWLQHANKQHLYQSFVKFIRYVMQGLTLAAGALLVIDGKLDPSSMVASNFLVARALAPLDQLVASWSSFVSAKNAFFRLEDLFKSNLVGSEIFNNAQNLTNLNEITLKKFSAFAIDEKGNEKSILQNINFKCQAGQVIAILGQSGSGKSTFARSLVGVWPHTHGNLYLNKISIDQWPKKILGPLIGYIPQDVEIIDGTFAENISRFYDLDSEKVIEAARLSGIHEMILKFPSGYNTLIGEGGAYLSGGQKQRLGLARALYNNPSLIVLDEPNSNLDHEGDKALFSAIKHLKSLNKIILFVTHRSNLVEAASHILVIESGKVSQFGDKDKVLKTLKIK